MDRLFSNKKITKSRQDTSGYQYCSGCSGGCVNSCMGCDGSCSGTCTSAVAYYCGGSNSW